MAKHRTVDSFTDAIQDFVDDTATKAATKSLRRVSLATYKFLLEKSPVKDGTYRANWYPAVNEIPTNVDLTLTGAAPIRGMQEFKIGDTLVYANNVPYAARIESGWSDNAKQGVAGPVKRIIENLIRSGKL